MSQILQPYNLPVVYNDLTQEEVLRDVFFALQTLTGTIDDVFGRIDRRVSDERRRVDAVKVRITACKQLVAAVKGSNKATTVFSTSKFPASKALPLYPTIYSHLQEMPSPYREIEDNICYLMGRPEASSVDRADLTSEIEEIAHRLNAHNTAIERVEFIMEDHGLGSMPPNIPSVGSILVFNSSINPYKEYQTLDNLISHGREKAFEEDTSSKSLASAPMTIMTGDELPDIQTLDLLFKPTMGQVNMLALPENLPLDFIASGIQFNVSDLPSIAPSAAKANLALPQITDGRAVSSASSKKAITAPSITAGPPPPSSIASAGSIPPPSSVTLAPPPPPPPPTSVPFQPPVSMAVPTQPQVVMPPPPAVNNIVPTVVVSPPPPPPPSLARIMDPPPPQQQQEQPPSKPALPAPAGPKSSLLDAIKGMSVSSLRSREDSSTPAASSPRKKADPSKPVSMQDALKERLARRNNALSGKDEKDQKRKDSLVVLAARMNNEAPVSSLRKAGFADVEHGDMPRGLSSSRLKSTASSDDDSVASDFSDSNSKRPPSKRDQTGGKRPSLVDIIKAQSAPPATRRGSGLLDTSNKALANMLSKSSSNNTNNNNKKKEDDDDDDWD